MLNLGFIQRYGRIAFLTSAAVVVSVFLLFSSSLINDLAATERERMEIWAGATREIVASTLADDGAAPANIDFLLSIIQGNTTIPVLLTDADGNLLDQRNFDLPVPEAPDDPANTRYLAERYRELRSSTNRIEIEIAPGTFQYLYYEDSTLLKRMSVFPYVQLLVMLAFIAVVYFAVLSTKKAEQNKVWVGLSKETAHQLGTPISSLMAWMELLPDMGVDADTVAEMNKDVSRLSTIASRFSKIGSEPKMTPTPIAPLVAEAVRYMGTRISQRIALTYSDNGVGNHVRVAACAPLLEWVIENLIKNAVDAMDTAAGRRCAIAVSIAMDGDSTVAVDVQDTGRGIARKNFKTVFNAGYTTQSRGWGLGLTLAKRIIEQYHRGRIFVARSSATGTTFRIELPVTRQEE